MDTAALIVTVLGSVCLFLFGMKWMGSALQRLSGGPLRRALRSMTLSTGRSVLSGTLITAVVQSSSVVTVMIVSFVHARLLGLRQAVAMILGANVGTTVTAWLVVLLGFGFDSTSVAMALLIPAFGMSALGRKRTRDAGRMLCGLALLLLAIGIFGSNVASLTGRPAVTDWLAGLNGRGAGTVLLFALAGALLTALVQSSSAMTAFTIVLCGGGLIPFEYALAMVLGENVGTTATANLAAVVTSADARRAALSHFLINLFGVLWALPLLPWLALGIADLIVWAGGVSPLTSAVSQPVGLALFHTLFNAVNAMLLFPLVPRLAGLTRRLIRGKGRTRQAGSGAVRVPRIPEGELSAYPLRVLLAKRVRAVYGMFSDVRGYFGETDPQRAGERARDFEEHRRQSAEASREAEGMLSAFGEPGKALAGAFGAADACAAACGDVLDVLRSKRSEGIWFAPGQRAAAQERMERIDRALLRAVRRAERLADPIAESEEEQAVGIPVEPSEAWPAWEEEEAPPRSEAVLEKLLARTECLSEAVVRLLAGLDGI
ncbi:Na/Pi cotransporter family protein [Alistipes ihumii]|uniref:Na/Pi cotransporter family protein n=5 Tax=Alistipes ihumii TaxID=1470347 RepID=UPI00265CE526|nr:Na/Pi symporter [Alistipes ihumii]